MKITRTLLAAAGLLALAVPARAAYVQADFSGTIAVALPGAPASFAAGTPITFDLVFDTSKLVDKTAAVDAATGHPFSSVLAASLADDPHDSLTIKVGGQVFTKFDQQNYGTPEGDCGAGCDLGAGNFPVATYLDGVFAGVGNIFINGAGYSIDSDPIADALGGFSGFKFVLSQVTPADPTTGAPLNPFGMPLAVGNFDAAGATFTPIAVPEPAAWSLMVMGFGALGVGLRSRRRRDILAA